MTIREEGGVSPRRCGIRLTFTEGGGGFSPQRHYFRVSVRETSGGLPPSRNDIRLGVREVVGAHLQGMAFELETGREIVVSHPQDVSSRGLGEAGFARSCPLVHLLEPRLPPSLHLLSKALQI